MKKKYFKKAYIEKQKGFSLIEMMVVVVILGLIVLGLVTFFTGGVKSWVAGQSQLEAQRNARQAMDIMVREIREGDSIAASDSNATSITVNYVTLGKSPVTYSLSSGTTTIKRGTIDLINNVLLNGEDIFRYYNSNDVEVTSPDSTVSKVRINLKVDVDDDGNPDITLDTDVNLRNYGL